MDDLHYLQFQAIAALFSLGCILSLAHSLLPLSSCSLSTLGIGWWRFWCEVLGFFTQKEVNNLN